MVEANTKYDYNNLLKNLEDLQKSIPEVNPDAFYRTMLEFVKIFDFMGSALQIAFKDITTKVGIIKKNYADTPEVTGGIMDFIKYEEGKKIQRLNGENPKEAPEPKYAKYESTTRTVLRLMWFFDYVSLMVGNLHADRKMKVSEACKLAYDQALAPHHPFTVRAAAKTAMTFAPNREKLLSNLLDASLTEEQKYDAIKKMLDLVGPIKTFLWDYYTKNGLTTLP